MKHTELKPGNYVWAWYKDYNRPEKIELYFGIIEQVGVEYSRVKLYHDEEPSEKPKHPYGTFSDVCTADITEVITLPHTHSPLPETETGVKQDWEAFEKEIDELENALWDEPTGAPPTPGNEQRSQIWPEKITAAEVEAGVKWSFAVCFEIARRYNEYKEAPETEVTRLKDLLNSLQGMQPWITDRELQEKFTSVMNQINQ